MTYVLNMQSNFEFLRISIQKYEYERNLSCDDELPWKEGSTLFNFINGVEMRGLTGPIR
jgi:hypothetical protein